MPGSDPDSRSSTKKIRVVVADDHPVVREGTRELLEREGDIEVVGEAADGAAAVRLVEQLRPDVAILDVSMPRMNGIEATKRIKQSRPSTAVLILTQYDYEQYVVALLTAGAAGYLLKDVPSAEVVQAVRSVYAGEPVLHPLVARKMLAYIAAQSAPPTTTPGGLTRLHRDLTERERGILCLAASGLSNSSIAEHESVSVRTVQTHLSHIFDKLGVGSRTEAVITGLRRGLFELKDLDAS